MSPTSCQLLYPAMYLYVGEPYISWLSGAKIVKKSLVPKKIHFFYTAYA